MVNGKNIKSISMEFNISELLRLKNACDSSISIDQSTMENNHNGSVFILKERIKRTRELKEKIQLACNKIYANPSSNNPKVSKTHELMYYRIKRMTPEEMREFIYWVYMNGNEDGQKHLQDSPERSYFGGAMLLKDAKDIMPNDKTDDLWDNFNKIFGGK